MFFNLILNKIKKLTINKKINNNFFIYCFIILIAGLLSIIILPSLWAESLWWDELYSLFLSHLNIIDMIKMTISDVHPPLYYFFLHFWFKSFTVSALSARLPSLFFGIISLFTTYHLTKILFSKKAALLSVYFVALSNIFVWAIQETRSYSFFLFLSSMSYLFFLKFKQQSNKKNTIIYVFINILLLYTHIYSIFIIISQNLFYFYDAKIKKIKLKKWIYLQGFIIFFFFPWFIVEIFQYSQIFNRYLLGRWFIENTSLPLLIKYFKEYFGTYFIFYIYLFVLFISLFKIQNNKPNKTINKYYINSSAFLFFWIIPSIVLPILISIYLPMFIPRYISFLIIPINISLAIQLCKLKSLKLKIILIVFISILSFSNIHSEFLTNNQKPEWEKVNNHINKLASPNDLFIFSPAYTIDSFMYYHKNKVNHLSYNHKINSFININKINLSKKTWYIVKNGINKPVIEEEFKKNHKLINISEFSKLKVYLFVKK